MSDEPIYPMFYLLHKNNKLVYMCKNLEDMQKQYENLIDKASFIAYKDEGKSKVRVKMKREIGNV